jgi:hypothetical protein
MSQQGMDKDSMGALKKMGDDVMKTHKQCAAEISATKKLREEVSEEIASGISKFGEYLLKHRYFVLSDCKYWKITNDICSERAWTSHQSSRGVC